MVSKNILLEISYKGTNYYGFQRQEDKETIQGVLEKNLSKNLGEDIVIISSGRTDRGVHARRQLVNFYTSSKIPVGKIPRLVNYDLPKDITILNAMEVEQNFHSRAWAKSRIYAYNIYNSPQPSALYEDISWHVYEKLDVNKMKEAGKLFLGCHDFSAFVGQGSDHSSPYREIYSICIEENLDLITIYIEGSSFLKNMVRIIVGSIVDVGRNKKTIIEIQQAINKGNRNYAGITSPAKGLILMEVKY